MKKIYFTLLFALSAFIFLSCEGNADSGGEGTNGTAENSAVVKETNANSEEGMGNTGEIGASEEGTTTEESPIPVSYKDDFQSIKAAILKNDATQLAKYAALEEWQTVDELISLFDETFKEMLKKTSYADLADTKLNGKVLKDLTLMANYGEEGEDEMESALMVYMETRPEGLRIVQYLMAG